MTLHDKIDQAVTRACNKIRKQYAHSREARTIYIRRIKRHGKLMASPTVRQIHLLEMIQKQKVVPASVALSLRWPTLGGLIVRRLVVQRRDGSLRAL